MGCRGHLLVNYSFFNATTQGNMKPVDGSRRKLPTEVVGMVLGYITDLRTHQALMKVSKTFGDLCLKQPLLIDGVRLLKALPEGTETPKGGLRFLAADLTGLQFHITINKVSQYSENA